MKKIVANRVSLCLFALRHISIGDEIRYDYGPDSGGKMYWRQPSKNAVSHPVESEGVDHVQSQKYNKKIDTDTDASCVEHESVQRVQSIEDSEVLETATFVPFVEFGTVQHAQSDICDTVDEPLEPDTVVPFLEFNTMQHVQSDAGDETVVRDSVAIFVEGDSVQHVHSDICDTVDEPLESDTVTPFVKFEDENSLFKPCFVQLEHATCIDLSGNITSGIFTRFPSKTTRKALPYCECCETHYSSLRRHLCSYQHRMFVITPSNYSNLDGLISDINRDFESVTISGVNGVEERQNEVASHEVGSSQFNIETSLKANRKLVDYSSSETASSILHSVVRQHNVFFIVPTKLCLRGTMGMISVRVSLCLSVRANTLTPTVLFRSFSN